MVKNRFCGSKHKKQKHIIEERNIQYALPGQDYALVISVSGGMRFKLLCNDGIERLGILRGKHRKRMWVNIDDIVLYEPWEFQSDKCSIILKYSDQHRDKLISNKEINNHILLRTNENEAMYSNDIINCPFIFDKNADNSETDSDLNSESSSDSEGDDPSNESINKNKYKNNKFKNNRSSINILNDNLDDNININDI